jgi:hypothetical protein
MNLPIKITESGVAWYAALVSTCAFGLSLYLTFRDRAKLRLHALWDRGLGNDWIEGSVRNCGRRPIWIDRVEVEGYEWPWRLPCDFDEGVERTLEEGNPPRYELNDDDRHQKARREGSSHGHEECSGALAKTPEGNHHHSYVASH